MALNNRFHKTTQGVAYELVIADSLLTTAGTTLNAFSAAGPLRRMAVFAESAIAAQPVSLATGVVIPAADRKKNIIFGYTVEQDSAGVFQVRHSTSCRADMCRAELVPYKAPTLQVATIVNAGVGTLSIQQRLVVKIIETTPMNIPMPTWDFDENLILGQTAAFAKIIAKINSRKEEEFFTATAVANGMQITSLDANRHFKIVASIMPTKADPSETGVYYNYTLVTPSYAGTGTLAQVRELQFEDNVRRGVGHYHPNTPMVNDSDFGLPVEAIGATTTFDVVMITVNQREDSPTPKQEHYNKKYIYICVPVGQGANIVAMFNF
jgi:hypothetical protein